MRFLHLSQITIEAAILTVLVLLVSRILFRRLDPGVRYFLWIFVALRILVPVRIEILPKVPEAMTWRDAGRTEAEIGAQYLENHETAGAGEVLENLEREEPGKEPQIDEEEGPEEAREQDNFLSEQEKTDWHLLWRNRIFFYVWLSGAVAMAICLTANNIRLSFILKVGRREAGTLPDGIPLYDVPGFNCLAGVFCPAVYIDMDGLKDAAVIENVILHERQHLKRGDHFWQLLRVVCLILQWHNPFVWWAYFASKQDGELACDAGVVREMPPQRRYLYGESLLAAAACVRRERPRGSMATPAGGARRFLEKRIRRIMQYRHGYGAGLSAAMICILGMTCFAAFSEPQDNILTEIPQKEKRNSIIETTNTRDSHLRNPEVGQETMGTGEDEYRVELEIEDDYITNTGTRHNLYYIDEDQVLWGCGENMCGQLGREPQELSFTSDMVKIAENVIHVDCSQEGFVIYLTADHKLYGMGNGASGALPRYEKEEWMKHVNREFGPVTQPCLLMEDVVYARCGRSDVACMKTDDSVWIFGVVGYGADREHFYSYPVKVLENAALVTGGFYNHAALLQDGSLWTWGNNYAGNCGTKGVVIPEPIKVAENVAMVWTGRTDYNVDCRDFTVFQENYEEERENTVILTADGSYWICGANVGTEKILPIYYETGNFPMVCSDEFIPWQGAPE